MLFWKGPHAAGSRFFSRCLRRGAQCSLYLKRRRAFSGIALAYRRAALTPAAAWSPAAARRADALARADEVIE